MNPIQPRWEESFDERFYPITETREDEFHSGRFWGRKDTLQEVRQFISETIASRDEALIELVNALEVGKPNSESEIGVYEIKKAWLEETKKALLEAIRSSREG